jgi:hypothetical protein
VSQVPEDGNANVAREAVERTARRAHAFEAALIALACFAVIVSSVTAVAVGLGNRHRADRERKAVADRSEREQKATADAIQVILDYIDRSFSPHRLRNEAENMCQVELFAGSPAYAAKGVGPALTFYDECVLRRSGNTAPPPVPPNPLTTTTTTGGRP